MHWYEVQVTKADDAEGYALEPAELPSFSILLGKLLKMYLRL